MVRQLELQTKAMQANHTGAPILDSAAFTLIEVLIAMVVIAVGTVGAISLFSSTIRQTYAERKEQEIEAAIARDILEIDRINRRLVCTAGSCSVLTSDPSENAYYPDPTSSSGVSFFNSLCTNQTLAAQAVGFVDSQARPTEFSTLGITRNPAAVESYTSSPSKTGHRYIVTWIKSGQATPIRQITRTPTVAHWCP
mgnify:FL=1